MQTPASTPPVATWFGDARYGDEPDREAFTVTLLRSGRTSIVQVSGELDMATAPKLADLLRCSCRADTSDLQIDVARMNFCDCSGLSVLLAAAHRRHGRGERLTLINPSTPLRRLISLVGLDQALCMRPAVTDAAHAVVADQDKQVS